MGLNSLANDIKLKVAEKVTENLAAKAERGEMGPTVQKAYVKTKGFKTVIGTALFIVTMAVDFYGPPWSAEYTRLSALVFLGLGWLGFVDKARRNEPIFDPWLLDALSQASATLAAISAVTLSFTQSGIVKMLMPNDPWVVDYLTIGSAVTGSIGVFLNRALKASALPAQPKDLSA